MKTQIQNKLKVKKSKAHKSNAKKSKQKQTKAKHCNIIKITHKNNKNKSKKIYKHDLNIKSKVSKLHGGSSFISNLKQFKDPSKTRIIIYPNNIGDDGAKQIADALKTNKTLKSLIILRNNISETGAEDILLSVLANHATTLTKLKFIGNNISEDLLQFIKKLIKRNRQPLIPNTNINPLKIPDIIPPLEEYKSSISTNNDIIVNENIEFIKKNIKYNNLSNNLNTRELVFNEKVNNLTTSYDYFKSLINNNYNNGIEAIKKTQPQNTTQQVVIDLHGAIINKLFKLPPNINIVFLSSIDYFTCQYFTENRKIISQTFDTYLKNPSCIEDPEVKNMFNQAVIYYGGQYCIDLDIGRDDVKNKEHVTGIHFINDSITTNNKLTQANDILGNIPKYNTLKEDTILSILLNNFNKAGVYYTILLTSCRVIDGTKKVIDSLKFYERTIKILNFKINYDNLNQEEKSKNTLDNYKKHCEEDNYNNISIKRELNQVQFYNDIKIKTSNISSRDKSNISKTKLIYDGKDMFVDELKQIISAGITEADFENLYKAINFGKIYHNYVSEDEKKKIYIIKYLFENKYEECFNFMMYCFEEIDVYYLSEKLNYDIKNLDISFLLLFMNIIPELKSLSSIKIKNSFKKNKAIALFLIKYLENNTTLTTLDISYNYFGVDDSIAIVDALKTITTLTTLNISYNKIDIADLLKTNTTLTTLNISYNKIADDGAIAIADLLKTNTTLTTLNISYNKIADDGAIAIAKALETNRTLTTLNIDSNNIGDVGAIAIAKALETNRTLTTLIISRNNFSDLGAIAIADLLKTNTTLTILNISSNKIYVDGAKAIADALKTNKTLRTLYISNYDYISDTIIAIDEASKVNTLIKIIYI